MSKYTTQVRFICEQASGLDESVGYNDVNAIINKAIPKVFNFDFPIFDENYRFVLERKILKHFYTREIGLETVGLWKLKLDTKLNEIMPYYNKLYESELLKFNPLYTKNMRIKRDDKIDGKNNTSSRNNGSASGNSKNKSKYSDTPQGGLVDLEADRYLTNATIDENTASSVNSNTGNVDSNNQSVEDYLEVITGYEGKSGSELVKEYRDILLNIDMMIIDDLEELFMQLW